MRIVGMFPGQGSQYTGMMRTFYEESNLCRDLVGKASALIGSDLESICFSNKENILQNSCYAQVALLTFGYASFLEHLNKYRLKPSYLLGHSLGEITALVSAEALSFNDGVELVYQRGKLMDAAAKEVGGKMLALRDFSISEAENLCNKYSSTSEICVIAGFNGFQQIVLSGHLPVLESILSYVSYSSHGKAKMLDVAGAFHSPLMKLIITDFQSALQRCQFNVPRLPVISTVDGQFYTYTTIKDKLLKQLTSPVLWSSAIKNLNNLGIDMYIDFGPNITLRQLVFDQIKKEVSIGKKIVLGIDTHLDREQLTNYVVQSNNELLKQLVRICICCINIKQSADYENEVLKPYRSLESIFKSSKVGLVPLVDLESAFYLAEQILSGKGYDVNYIKQELQPILARL